ncbi:MAG: hypothetical protein KatS3mg017_0642 [Fimbriimonadales bacterium]|nr:MAG: hypothetical protein KatS3mg017_0642 [Fimbriimonadales bacterium]
MYLYCGNDPINYSDSDGIAEDLGGSKGSIRVVIAHFIPSKEIPGAGEWFAGDNRGFSERSGSCRLQIITKGKDGKPIIQQRVEVGETRITRVGDEDGKEKLNLKLANPFTTNKKTVVG